MEQNFAKLLENQDVLLDTLWEKQAELRDSVTSKKWEKLVDVIDEINSISEEFIVLDKKRESIQKNLTTEELKPYRENLNKLRSKLLKCKVENKVLGEYVTITRQFIQEVVDEAIPKNGNKNYSKKGEITQPSIKSVLVDLKG